MTEAQVGRALAGLRPRRGHRLAGEGRAGARLHADLVRARASTRSPPPSSRPVRRGRADAVRDLGLRRRLLGRPHEEPRLRRAEAGVRGARGAARRRLRRRRRLLPARARASPSSTGASASGLDAIGTPVPVSHPICHGIGARAHEPPYAHQAGGGEIQRGHGARRSSPASTGRAAAASASRTTS